VLRDLILAGRQRQRPNLACGRFMKMTVWRWSASRRTRLRAHHAGQDSSPANEIGEGGTLQAGPMRLKPPLVALAVTLALASALAGCQGASGPAADGPLSSGSSRYGPVPTGGICVPGGKRQTFGVQTFTNFGNAVVVLDRVVLLHPHRERLIGSYAVPGNSSVGAPGGWPPGDSVAPLPPAWKHRQPVHGFRLAPGKTFTMVLGVLATTSARATSQGMLVYYHDSAGSYVAKNYFANIIAAVKHTC
jgi:hypothetical protein